MAKKRAMALRHLVPSLALLAACAALGGCGDEIYRDLGLIHDAPDEFSVTTRAPLAMPPDFSLPPPRPGAPRPQEQSERQKAEQALVPQMALGGPPAANSPGQQALVQAAGPPAPGDIREEVNAQAQQDRPHEGLVDRLMFWREPTPPGIVVDPQKEAQRLRENSALGQSPEIGDTPIVQPRKRGWLEGLF